MKVGIFTGYYEYPFEACAKKLAADGFEVHRFALYEAREADTLPAAAAKVTVSSRSLAVTESRYPSSFRTSPPTARSIKETACIPTPRE